MGTDGPHFAVGKLTAFGRRRQERKISSLPSSSLKRKTKSYLEKITQKPTFFPFLFEGPAHTAVSHICGIENKLFRSKKKYTQQKLGKQYGGRPFLIPPNSAGIFLPSFFGERNCCEGWKLSSFWKGGVHFGGVRFQKTDFFLPEKILRKNEAKNKMKRSVSISQKIHPTGRNNNWPLRL